MAADMDPSTLVEDVPEDRWIGEIVVGAVELGWVSLDQMLQRDLASAYERRFQREVREALYGA